MADQPTCKVVKRQGQRGARIAPKGCKVRTEVTGGSWVTRNKAGQTKISTVEYGRSFTLAVTGVTQESVIAGWLDRSNQSKRDYKDTHQIVYDTGAMVTLMSRTLLERLGINWRRRNNTRQSNVVGVGGAESLKVLNATEFYVQIDAFTNQWTKVTADIHVFPEDNNVSNLLGVDAIKQLKRLKVKFRP